MIDTGTVTAGLLDLLRESTGQLLGDGLRPESSGWLDGDVNSGVFAPYGVLVFAGAQIRDAGSLGYAEQVMAWSTSWRLSYFGASRSQCDLVAGKIRAGVRDVIGQVYGGYQVTGLKWVSLGGMVRDDSLNPALWSVSDALNLVLDA